MVALAGIEPARPYRLAILSRVRLPIPPQGHREYLVDARDTLMALGPSVKIGDQVSGVFVRQPVSGRVFYPAGLHRAKKTSKRGTHAGNRPQKPPAAQLPRARCYKPKPPRQAKPYQPRHARGAFLQGKRPPQHFSLFVEYHRFILTYVTRSGPILKNPHTNQYFSAYPLFSPDRV